MPVEQIPPRKPSPIMAELTRRLVEEWRHPKESGQPLILLKCGAEHQPTHVYVIWDDWADLPQQERSEIIMDAFESTHSPEEALDVTVAMGLTPEEADRMKFPHK